MRHTKFQFNWYQANDTAAMEHKLEKMAEKGWLLEKMTNWGFRYKWTEPRKVRYSVTYFPNASVYDAKPTEEQQTYADYCAAAGWEFVGNWGPLQIFRSFRENLIPIETDEAEKLEATHKSMLKTVILSEGMLLVVWILNLILRFSSIKRNPLGFFSSNRDMLFVGFLLFFVAYMAFFLADYFIWYFRSKREVERGGVCLQPHTKTRFWLSMVLLGMCVLVFASWFGDASSAGSKWILAYSLGGMALMMVLSQGVLNWMKRRGYERKITRKTHIGLAVVLAVVYAAGIVPFVTRLNDADRMQEPDVEVYVDSRGHEWEIHHDELPVTLEDLGYTVTKEDHCTYMREINKSLLLTHTVYVQRAYGDASGLPNLHYEVVTARWDWMLDWSWKLLYHVGERLTASFTSEPLDPAPWGAEAAFYNRFPYGYCLRYEDKILILDQNQALTEAEFSTVVNAI